jgi:caffeoyl-CoA O-methyltransferase
MNKQFGNEDPRIADFLARTYGPEDETLREIRERSAREGLPDIQVAALDARHLEVLARALGARRAVEIGSLGGYSGVSILRGMSGGAGGDFVLHTLELDPHHAEVARESFRRAGFADRARVHVGRAADLLPRLEPEGPFDLVFIDADKEGYPAYLDWAARHLRPGGAVIGDNAFLFGRLPEAPSGEHAASIEAMQAFHRTLASSALFRATVLPTGEGLALGIRV